MTLIKVADELEETAKLSAALSDSITVALRVLASASLGNEAERGEAIRKIVIALQTEDRVAQRCQHLAIAVREFAKLPHDANDTAYRKIWMGLPMDELRGAGQMLSREPELF